MRANVNMERTRSCQSVQRDQEGHQASDRCCTPCPESGERQKVAQETLSLSEHQKSNAGNH